jgi:hypothetical protein
MSEVLSGRCCDYLPPLCCLGSGHIGQGHIVLWTHCQRDVPGSNVEGTYRKGDNLYLEYQRVSPIVGIGSTHPLPSERVCLPPATVSCWWGGGGTQFARLDIKPGTLYNLWDTSSKGRVLQATHRTRTFVRGHIGQGPPRYGIFRITQTRVSNPVWAVHPC